MIKMFNKSKLNAKKIIFNFLHVKNKTIILLLQEIQAMMSIYNIKKNDP